VEPPGTHILRVIVIADSLTLGSAYWRGNGSVASAQKGDSFKIPRSDETGGRQRLSAPPQAQAIAAEAEADSVRVELPGTARPITHLALAGNGTQPSARECGRFAR
jgi:hypothetical protein